MKKLLALLLALVMVVGLVACGGNNNTNTTTTEPDTTGEVGGDASYVRADDEEVYAAALGDFLSVYEASKECESISERFAMMAKAEAYQLDSAVMVPNTTENGAYTISRVAPRTVPYVQWGNDDDRLKGLVISDEFLTPAEREELLDIWAKACNG